ncbi:TRAP-type C4-dicarboxylate transport system permease small subunit [Loktanella sp. PT4BL]|jgi:TRAP-type C4-dicarboxylate transport system permease small subunit|uniref:TRAP transporter small permease n=1 Tax=Loktanella sp. PT4BL TaxID=2135611 RepID=UPI000D75A8B6|nr:TRAP transporter small permease subunit [Loktanella sp. PT4BL]PXW70834.1 TRAP-type C4-dicarboxylate transport system permease small subunit [Loktanella sp. PT4BL]
MSVLFGLLWPLERFNTVVLAIGKVIAVIALAIMVALILGQVFFRYVLSDAPNWTEEGARFGMLWMTGLMAPLAFRMGGFVSIDMLERALPRVVSGLLTLLILSIALWVLVIAWERGLNNHVQTLSGRGCSSSLRWPFGIEIGKCGAKFQNNYQYASLFVGVNLLILVNVELIIRQIIKLLGQGDRLTPLNADDFQGAD